jgi:AAA domain/Primase C terminal 2 (PriCT-2)/VirE N-terminal domain
MMLDANVSLFHGSYDTTVQETLALGTVLHRIQAGTYRPYVEQLRRILRTKGEKAYKVAKEKSWAFTPCCSLTTRDKALPWGQKLTACTGLVHLDCDGVDDPEGLKAQLAQHGAVVFAFVSPRGNGLKIGIAATGIEGPDTYKHAWDVVVEFIRLAYPAVRVNVDEQVKYLHALCYMSYDPAPYINPDATPLRIPPKPKPATPRGRPPEDRADYGCVMSALYAIPNQDASYDDWLELGMALHSTSQPWAREAWEDWSRQSAKYDEAKQAKSWRSFTADGKTTLGTLFHRAQTHGWSPPRTASSNGTAPRHNGATPGPMAEDTPAPFARALLSFQELLALELPPLALHLDWLINPSINLIYGPAGVGKTNFLLSLGISLAAGTPFLKWDLHHTGCGVLYIDGEMAIKELQDRADKMAGSAKPEPLRFLPSELVQRRTERDLTLTSPQNRDEIDAMLHDHPHLKVLVLDNVSCLFPGIDEDKKTPWEPINAWLIRLRHRGITVLVGHHAGKSGSQRGTSGRGDHVNTIIALVPPPGHTARDGCHFQLHFDKSRGVSGDAVEPLDVRLEEMSGELVWTCASLEASRTRQIQLMLLDGMPPRAIAEELKITASYVYRLKRKLGL